ncbi:MAG: hutH [Enterovirga sp.]|nr:hutH [Enterovirga sp.]
MREGSELTLSPGQVPFRAWRRILREGPRLTLAPGSREQVEACRRTVVDLIATGRPLYGVNTGFGRLASVRIPDAQLGDLQTNLILSHAAGTGELLPDGVVRLILAMKATALAQGYSGVRWTVVEALMALVNAGVFPCVPSKGSVGASGDLAPLAHIGVALLGLGEVRHGGRIMPAADGLAIAGLSPLTLEAKEGVALINGTQVSTALALSGLFLAEDIFRTALVTGAMAVEAALGNDTPFDPRIHAVRRHAAQIDVAAAYRALLARSPLREANRDRLKVQDPYCLRCQPQVMGACLTNLRHAAEVLATEANSVSDNPLVFMDESEILSGGNFHAEPVAFAADIIALTLCEIGSISERRQAMLVDASLSGLPAFLTTEPGLNSGFMLAQVTAAALTAENKMLAHPASVDSIPTSANQEDHVSMATHGAYRLGQMSENAMTIVALEWLTAAQGLDFYAPAKPAAPIAEAHRRLRAEVPHYDRDRFMAPDIATATRLVGQGAVDGVLPPELASIDPAL